MGFLKDERSKKALHGFKTVFFLITMIISFLFFSSPILFAVADALLPTVLLSDYVSSPVPDPSPAYSFIQPLNSHLTSYDFRYSLIDIPLISIIRSAIILCVYGLCDGPGLSRGPYLGITTVCSVVTLLFVSVKAAYVFGGSNSGFTAVKVALFVCSMSLAVGHIVVAYRTSCRERRKLLVFKIDIEAQKKQINKREINTGGQVYMAEEFQSEVCNGSWWSSTRATFNSSSFMANYGGCWQNDFMNMKTTRSTDESSPDSAFQIMGSSPSTTTNWNLVNGRNEESYNQSVPEILNQDFGMEQHQQTSYGYPSSLLQTLFDGTPPPSPPSALPQQPLYDFQTNMNEFNSVSSMPSFSSLEKPKQQVLGGLHLANKTPFWNTPALNLNDNRAAFFASTQSQYLPSTYGEKPNCPNIKSQSEEIRDLESSLQKGSSEHIFKRPRLETPSPLPTFKVRKEKLGDRVTALQQLVSPFGKTDTASVLHEAIEYIKLLHDQVNVLSTPYMKNGTTMQRQEIHDKVKDNTKGAKQQDLRGRGLCLVPVSSTFPVTNETTPDYWTSSFGGTFR